MSLSLATHAQPIGKCSAWLDWLQMLTGASLILFMWSHMILVSSVIFGAGPMNALAEFFESTGMAQVGGPLIGLVFLFHFVLAARKVPFRAEQQTVMVAHARRMRHTDTWLWLVQAGTAMVILLMGSIHMWVVLTDLPITAAKSAARVQGGWWLVFYLLLLPMVELHVGIGYYRIGVKWGLIRRDNRKNAKKFENILTVFFIVIGLITLIRFLTLTV
ncbi:succinate dehydrogenase/fumarate reductase cytochrome b subunit [Desulfolutivibrio sulfoxidireducens]|uniref:succinate dehydrogenase/fumarate reductase cytochrome b subunit n=1 Tax=Desulfolutivibrio sulfoxidireducens TaxID=2773299 RepID=UPI00159DE23F|nr:succinate dehydrogenase/fumarate reductase cytochrome b subunit [Desulfolutivibrio sulfoxidireducens]QLA16923.1 succinate dehydrogenase/fumarate reductase cytochrome b subunit [Desulfolutivibrio sulfoxidireducens]QLA20489.1 succinate dehydrogenase/fumarate reductase cytochrome b subunit [Desulfolutivibrio sulfoxidireducens]